MHEPVLMNCLFGCRDYDQRDTLVHYLQCAPLWLLCSEATRASTHFDIEKRLCVKDPTVEAMQQLAVVFQGYHYAKSLCVGEGDSRLIVQDSRLMQSSVQQAMRQFAQTFGT